MKWVALCVGLTAGAIATAAIAEDAQPPMEPPAGNLSGTWRFIRVPVGGFDTGVENHGPSASECTFVQNGNQLSGLCKTVSFQGPIIGVISGQKIEWRWLFNAGDIRSGKVFAIDLFEGALSEDHIKGGFKTYPALDPRVPSFDYKKTNEFTRPTSFSASRE